MVLPKFETAVIVAQTTQNTAFYDEIKAWCKTHAPHYKIFDTICGSTERRQAEIRKLANENDAVIGMITIPDSDNSNVLVVSENGYGKRSDVENYRITNPNIQPFDFVFIVQSGAGNN